MLFATLLLAIVAGATASGSWGYGKTHGDVYGPSNWAQINRNCNGRNQSPVNIVTRATRESDAEDYPLKVRFSKRWGYMKGSLSNNGHSPTFSLDHSQGGAKLRNPVNNQNYKLEQFHFHFGCGDSVGSEHTVNGRHYPGELHMVFYNEKYEQFANAADKSDGLTVVGAFLRKGNSKWTRRNQVLRGLARKIEKISNVGSQAEDVGIYSSLLLPGLSNGSRSYFSYKGSLTTPNCYESVSWLVLKEPITVDSHLLKSFRKLKSNHGKVKGKMCDNYRPVQPLNGRRVRLFDDDD